MKKIKYIFPILFSVVMLFTACSEDRLEIPQKGVTSIESFYITDEDAESALVNAYKDFASNMHGVNGTYIYVPYNVLFNYCADNILGAGEKYGDNDFIACLNEFRHDADNQVIDNAYKRLYFIIYHANLVIDNFKYGESTVKDRCISEARVIRAFCHMMAAMAWGNPPLVDHVLTGDARPSNYEGGHEGLLRWCAKECEEAAAFIPERTSPNDKDGSVKVTKGFAQAVQGKALLYAGDYAAAKAPLKAIINSGKYQLVPGEKWRDLFHIEGDGCEEKVFELNLVRSASLDFLVRSTWMEANIWGWRSDRLYSQPTTQAIAGWGGIAVEENFAKEFYANDGNSYRRKATIITFEEFITEVKWPTDNTMTTNEMKLTDPKRGIKNDQGLYGQCEFLQIKHIASKEDIMQDQSHRFNNFIVSRYADILLMYAEACAQTNDPDGLQYLQAVQTRAGAPVSSALTLDNVKKERNYELWMECSRWIDMKRWGELDKAKNAGTRIPSLKDAYTSNENGEKEPQHRGYVTYSTPNEGIPTGFKAGKHEWFPYPAQVLRTNPNLKQNPGW